MISNRETWFRRLVPVLSTAFLSFAIVAPVGGQATTAPTAASGAVGDLSSGHIGVVQVIALIVGAGGFIWHAAVLSTTVKRNDKHTHDMRNALAKLLGAVHRVDRRLLRVEIKMGAEPEAESADDAEAPDAGITWFTKG